MRWVRTLFVGLAVFVSVVAASPPAHAYRSVLGVTPIAQQTPVWCWAATIEMVFRYHGAPNLNPGGNMQCAIVATRHPACWSNCFNCVVSAGAMANMVGAMSAYRNVARQSRRPFPSLAFYMQGRQSFAAIARSIDLSRPIIAGISPGGGVYPPGMSEHAIVLIGYDDISRTIILNDPMPYPAHLNPYARIGARRLMAGRYEVPYSQLVQILGYRDTIFIDR